MNAIETPFMQLLEKRAEWAKFKNTGWKGKLNVPSGMNVAGFDVHKHRTLNIY
jgi:hypothetical protein